MTKSTAKRVSAWGIASLVLLLGQCGFGEYHSYVFDHTGTQPWISFEDLYPVCAVVQSVAVFCGIMAMRRGSKWWALAVVPALLYACFCFLGNL